MFKLLTAALLAAALPFPVLADDDDGIGLAGILSPGAGTAEIGFAAIQPGRSWRKAPGTSGGAQRLDTVIG